MNTKKTLILLAITALFSVIVGCSSKSDELKLEVLEALSKQSEIKNYHFSGSANLQINLSTKDEQNPLSASLKTMLSSSKIAWEGIANTETAQMEADLSVTPEQLGSTIEMPIMIKDNKLYFNIPLLNLNEEEYLTFELDGDLTNLPFSSIFTHIVEGIDEEFFEEINTEADELNKTITIPITQENITDLIASLQNQLPLIIDELKGSKLINNEKADSLSNDISSSLEKSVDPTELSEPSLISITINQEGFITELSVQLHFANQSIEIRNTLSEINQNPSFLKEIPEQTRSLEDILN